MKFLVLLCLFFLSFSQEPQAKTEAKEILSRKQNSLVDKNGNARALFRLNEATTGSSAEERAKNYLQPRQKRSRGKRANGQAKRHDLRHVKTQRLPNSTHVRFQETFNGIDIYGADVVVSLNKAERVQFLMDNRKAPQEAKSAIPQILETAAIDRAFAHLNSREGLVGSPKAKLVYYVQGKEAHLVYKVNIALVNKTMQGDYEVLVDAQSGEIRRFENQIKTAHSGHKHKHKKKKTTAQGQGYVFDPDPLSLARKTYGATGFADANDSDSGAADSLNAYRKLVTLNDLTLDGGLYHLKNNYVELEDFEFPTDTFPAFADPNAFLFTRSQQGFEAVNVFYHLDKSARYLESLGFLDIKPDEYSGGIKADPHGLSGDDNSHFLPSQDKVSWGEGGVDDAEDADVIWHEYGHAVQDFIVAGFAGNEGMGEGFCDYWAQSYSRSVTNWTSADPEYHHMFSWDGHNEYWDGRTTNLAGHYPESKNGNIHHDGQLWATPLMQLYDRVGREVCDKIVIQSHYYLSASANQVAGAEALLQASNDLYGGQYNADILDVFRAYGQLAHIVDNAPPENILISAHNSEVKLRWESPSEDALSYSVSRSTSKNGIFQNVATEIQTLQFSDTSAVNNITYFYFLTAHYADTTSYSDTLSALPRAGLNGKNFAVIQLGNGQVAERSALRLQESILANGGDAPLISFLPRAEMLSDFNAIFVSLGAYSSNHILSESDWQNSFQPYLESGGKLYLEGADTWAYDHNNGGTGLHHSYFGINGLNDGNQSPPSGLSGSNGNITDGLNFAFSSTGEEYVDQIAATGGGSALFWSNGNTIVRVVSNSTETYKTIGAAPSFGGFVNSTGQNHRDSLMNIYLAFFSDPEIAVNTDSIIAEGMPADSSFSISFIVENLGSSDLEYTVTPEINGGLAAEDLFLSPLRSETVHSGDSVLNKFIVNETAPFGIYSGHFLIESNDLKSQPIRVPFRIYPHGPLQISLLSPFSNLVYNQADTAQTSYNLDELFSVNSFRDLDFSISSSDSTIAVAWLDSTVLSILPTGKIGVSDINITASIDTVVFMASFTASQIDTKEPEFSSSAEFGNNEGELQLVFSASEYLQEPAYILLGSDSVLLSKTAGENTYRATLPFTAAAHFEVTTLFADSTGNETRETFSYTYAAGEFANKRLTLADGLQIASVPSGQHMLIRHDSLNATDFSPSFNPVSPQMTITLGSGEAVQFAFNVRVHNEQVALYTLVGNTWELVSYQSAIHVSSNGTFALFYNADLVYVPDETEVLQNYPNPFNPSTTIKLYLKQAEHVRIDVYNSLGKKVTTLINELLEARRHNILWDGTNSNGERVASGIYFYHVRSSSYNRVKRMILIK